MTTGVDPTFAVGGAAVKAFASVGAALSIFLNCCELQG